MIPTIDLPPAVWFGLLLLFSFVVVFSMHWARRPRIKPAGHCIYCGGSLNGGVFYVQSGVDKFTFAPACTKCYNRNIKEGKP